MRLLVFILLLSLTSCSQSYVLYVQPNDVLDLRYDYELTDVELRNKSGQQLEVAIKDDATKEKTGGFGFSPRGKVNVTLERGKYIHFTNNSSQKIPIRISPTKKEVVKPESPAEYISFTLSNTSGKSIPLIIPNVMNPNLSPNSNSGVDLAIGQEILFKEKGKRHLLLKVDDTIRNGEKIDVAVLLQSRRKTLGL